MKLTNIVVLGILVICLSACRDKINNENTVTSNNSSLSNCQNSQENIICSADETDFNNPSELENNSPDTEDHLTEPDYVEWQAAPFYSDGSDMDANEVSRYEITYGDTIEELDNIIDISPTEFNSFDLNQLPNGNWFVAVRTVSVFGSVSDISNIVYVSI